MRAYTNNRGATADRMRHVVLDEDYWAGFYLGEDTPLKAVCWTNAVAYAGEWEDGDPDNCPKCAKALPRLVKEPAPA